MSQFYMWKSCTKSWFLGGVFNIRGKGLIINLNWGPVPHFRTSLNIYCWLLYPAVIKHGKGKWSIYKQSLIPEGYPMISKYIPIAIMNNYELCTYFDANHKRIPKNDSSNSGVPPESFLNVPAIQ
jgi:hypothetical protein